MHIEAANVRPDLSGRQSIPADELRHVSEPCVIFEGDFLDDNGAHVWVYTVGGWLRGKPLGGIRGGALVGGDAMLLQAQDRATADVMASFGLQDTIEALGHEEAAYQEAHAALARLSEVSAVRRMELATAAPADMSDAFVKDVGQIRVLRGDDILLSGGVDKEGS